MTVGAEWISIVGDPDAWRALGLVVADDGLIPLHGTSLRIVAPDETGHPGFSADPETAGVRGSAESPPRAESGVRGWALSGPGPDGRASAPSDIDGLPTAWVEPLGPTFAQHALGATSLDHVVVLTADLARTSAAVAEATGYELRRIRELGTLRQGFHRIGERGRGGLIVELVERPDIPEGPATFWGIVLIVDDLDAACELIGAEGISAPKDAVQPGRRIATVRAEVGLGIPLALMTS